MNHDAVFRTPLTGPAEKVPAMELAQTHGVYTQNLCLQDWPSALYSSRATQVPAISRRPGFDHSPSCGVQDGPMSGGGSALKAWLEGEDEACLSPTLTDPC